MKWSPDPYPVMERWQRDGLRAYMIEHNGWGALPPIIVDEEGNLIDGYKRGEIYSQLAHQNGWPNNCPATVIQGAERYPDEAERAAAYLKLRQFTNSRPVVADEVEDWLRGQR
jgi:hypothetical protein